MVDEKRVKETLEAAERGDPTALGQAARMASKEGHPNQGEAADAVQEGMKDQPGGGTGAPSS